MRISNALKVLSAAAYVGLAGCSAELPSAPVAVNDLAAPSFAKGSNGKSSESSVVLQVNTQVAKRYSLGGGHWVYIPAGAICADGSGYGPEVWDAPCAPATGTVTIPVSVSTVDGHPAARFHNDVRFAPAANWRNWVILGLKIQGRLSTEGYGVLYQPTGSSELIDESLDDASLRAFRMPGNVLGRRLKHFSGYNVALGYSEQDGSGMSPNPEGAH